MKYDITQITEKQISAYLSSSIDDHKGHDVIPCLSQDEVTLPAIVVKVESSEDAIPLRSGVFNMDLSIITITQADRSGSVDDHSYLNNSVYENLINNDALITFTNDISSSLFIYDGLVQDVKTTTNDNTFYSVTTYRLTAQRGYNPTAIVYA